MHAANGSMLGANGSMLAAGGSILAAGGGGQSGSLGGGSERSGVRALPAALAVDADGFVTATYVHYEQLAQPKGRCLRHELSCSQSLNLLWLDALHAGLCIAADVCPCAHNTFSASCGHAYVSVCGATFMCPCLAC
jgi:hypothetical protein